MPTLRFNGACLKLMVVLLKIGDDVALLWHSPTGRPLQGSLPSVWLLLIR